MKVLSTKNKMNLKLHQTIVRLKAETFHLKLPWAKPCTSALTKLHVESLFPLDVLKGYPLQNEVDLINGLTWMKANYILIESHNGRINRAVMWWFFFFAPPPHLCACKCSRELTDYLHMDTARDQVQTIIKKEYYITGYLMRPGWFNASHFK